MPSYKTLRSVAHNTGHSFTSLMNYLDDDYGMGHLLRIARAEGQGSLTINLLNGEAQPQALLREPIPRMIAWYTQFFRDLVQRHGSALDLVSDAKLTIAFDLTIQRPWRGGRRYLESPYVCTVDVKDDRGKMYNARFEGWWFPETEPRRPWWRFWAAT